MRLAATPKIAAAVIQRRVVVEFPENEIVPFGDLQVFAIQLRTTELKFRSAFQITCARLLGYAEKHYPDQAPQLWSVFTSGDKSYTEKSIRNWLAVDRAIPQQLYDRILDQIPEPVAADGLGNWDWHLSFTLCRTAASLPTEKDREKWLVKAGRERWTSRDLERELEQAGAKPRPDKPLPPADQRAEEQNHAEAVEEENLDLHSTNGVLQRELDRVQVEKERLERRLEVAEREIDNETLRIVNSRLYGLWQFVKGIHFVDVCQNPEEFEKFRNVVVSGIRQAQQDLAEMMEIDSQAKT